MPLNVLPSITKPPVAGSRAPRWRLLSHPCRRPWPHSAASTTRSSVCARLTFSQPAPRRPASYGASSAFTITPSWPRASASSRNALGLLGGPGDRRAGRGARSGSERVERREPLARRAVEEVLAVDVEAVEEERRERDRSRASRSTSRRLPNRLIVTWNGCGRPSGAERDRLAVEDERARPGRARDRLDDLRDPVGDVGEVAREHADVVAEPVDLDARAVELPLDRRGADPRQSVRRRRRPSARASAGPGAGRVEPRSAPGRRRRR